MEEAMTLEERLERAIKAKSDLDRDRDLLMDALKEIRRLKRKKQ